MVILQKLHNSGLLIKLNGCVATGKEANVQHSVVSTDKLLENSSLTKDEIKKYANYYKIDNDNNKILKIPCAVKIFKTSILVFKNRQDYIGGDRRFKYGYKNNSNHRKLIELWMEKEMRNLRRIQDKASKYIRVPNV